MTEGAFACGPRVVACADGNEVLAYDPKDESPRWQKKLAAPVAALAVAGDEVIAVDERGELTRLAANDGAARGRTSLGAAPRALAASPSGALAVALDERVVVLAAGAAREGDGPDAGARSIDVADARALAFDGARLAIGTGAGKLVVVEGDATLFEGDTGDPVRGVARHPKGFWLVTQSDRVTVVDDKGESARFSRTKDAQPSRIAIARDGALVAVKSAARVVTVLAHPSKETVLTATYADRDVIDVAFDDDPRFVWIGVGKGDANKIDLDDEDVYRTDPPAGRPRATWTVKVALDKAARAKSKAHAAAAPKEAPLPAPPAAEASAPPRAAPAAPSAAREPNAHEEPAAPRAPSLPREPVLPPSNPADVRAVLVALSVAAALALLSLKWL